MNHLQQITDYMIESFLHTWPYLLVTIPIAVMVKISGAAKYIHRAFSVKPVAAIFLATFIGAFSPLCSCSVIPVVASLLIGGVPLAPVMSFWLASPSMDPEIFFLTVSTLGMELALWRLGATLIMSLAGGFVTSFLVQRGWLGEDILRKASSTKVKTFGELSSGVFKSITRKLREVFSLSSTRGVALAQGTIALQQPSMAVSCSTCSSATEVESLPEAAEVTCDSRSQDKSTPSFWKRLAAETWEATTLVIRFMLIAWMVGAVIHLYVPEAWTLAVLGNDQSWAIMTAALFGIPVYTSNLAAMPLVGGLLSQGMHPGAALAFLIAGPTTTLPAMSAVWGLVNRKVFGLYIGISLVSAVLLGYLYGLTL